MYIYFCVFHVGKEIHNFAYRVACCSDTLNRLLIKRFFADNLSPEFYNFNRKNYYMTSWLGVF